jgi:predicted acetyltransferase
LTKPWQDAELKETVRQALQFWKAVNETREAVLAMKKRKKAEAKTPP